MTHKYTRDYEQYDIASIARSLEAIALLGAIETGLKLAPVADKEGALGKQIDGIIEGTRIRYNWGKAFGFPKDEETQRLERRILDLEDDAFDAESVHDRREYERQAEAYRQRLKQRQKDIMSGKYT